MISKDDALLDLEKVKAEANGDVGKLLIGIAQVLCKLLVTIRSNQLLTDEEKKRIKADRERRFKENQTQK